MIKFGAVSALALAGILLGGPLKQNPAWGVTASAAHLAPDTPRQVSPDDFAAFTLGDRIDFECTTVDGAQNYTFRVYNGDKTFLLSVSGHNGKAEKYAWAAGAFEWDVYATDALPSNSPPSGRWRFAVYNP